MKRALLINTLAIGTLIFSGCGSSDTPGDVDTSISSTSIYATSGLFNVYGSSYTLSGVKTYISDMYKYIYENGRVKRYTYNPNVDSFMDYGDIGKGAFLDDGTNYDSDIAIRLVNGTWVSKTYGQWQENVTFTFNAADDFVITDGTHVSTITATGYDITGETVSSLYKDALDLNLSTEPTFSANAQRYEMSTVETGFIPSYEIYYWEKYDCSSGECIVIGNANYEDYYDGSTFVPYTSMTKFIADKTLSTENDPDSFGSDYLNFYGSDKDYRGFFSDSNNSILLYNNDDDKEPVDRSKLSIEGSYELKIIDGTEILVLTLPELVLDDDMLEDHKQIIFSVLDGALREGSYQGSAANRSWRSYNEVAARDIYQLIMSKNANTSSALAPVRSSSTNAVNTQEQRDRLKWISKKASRNAHKYF